MKIASRIATAVVLSLSVGLVACSSDDDSSDPTSETQEKSIIETAQAAGSFTTLVAAIDAAGLVDTLNGPGPFTVFAPTDAAFEKLPAGTVETLLKPENKQALTDILTYHVVSGDVRADQVVTLDAANTVNGASVSIKVMDGAVYLNDSIKVVQTDIVAKNGVIHVIDAVMLPPEG